MPTESRSKSRRPKGEVNKERSVSPRKPSKPTSKVSDRKEERSDKRRKDGKSTELKKEKTFTSRHHAREDTYVTLRDGSRKRVPKEDEPQPQLPPPPETGEKSKSVKKEIKKTHKSSEEEHVKKKSKKEGLPPEISEEDLARVMKKISVLPSEPEPDIVAMPPQEPLETTQVHEKAPANEEFDYDDDFEDYDDEEFEEESSSNGEEDKKMDSGNYQRARLLKEMAEVKAAMVRENSATNYHRDKAQPHDSGHGSNDEQHQQEANKRKPSGKMAFNFASAKQRQKSKIAAGQAKRRGDELLSMIRLDVAKYDLFDLPPIPYEALMGQTNRVQATSQTGEDDIDAELQTTTIETKEKWTQHPPPPLTSLNDPEDMLAVMQALRGVGGEVVESKFQCEFNHEGMKSINAVRLSKFLESASQALITVLEEDAERKYGNGREARDQKDVKFSEKVTLLDTDAVKCLEGRPVVAMSFALDQPALLLNAHGSLDDFRSYLTVWNISAPMVPLHILVTSGDVQSVCFSPSKASMAFAGMQDGSISVWDLRESQALHQEVAKTVDLNDEKIHRSSTFTTSSGEDSSHDSAVTGLKPVETSSSSSEGSYDDTFQIVSCEESGKVIIWTVLDALRDSDVHLGLAHWGCVRIVSSVQIEVDCMSAKDVIFGTRKSRESRGDLFVAMGNGHIFHGSIHAEHRPSPRHYKGELDSSVAVRSLAFCPFGGEQFFLAGCDDGSVRLHSVASEKPLITWPGTVDGQPILQILWSPSRPGVFYILDSDSRVHLWDLGVSDINPAHTVQFEEKVTVIRLNPELSDPRLKPMLALGMENGHVEVHHLKADYRASDLKSCTKELERFLHYVSII